MLSMKDYVSLKASIKGWNARRLASYGVSWPPVEGWRKRLLREYETAHPLATRRTGTIVAIPPVKSSLPFIKPYDTKRLPKRERGPRWKRMRPDSGEELEFSLLAEKRLTATWYERMSGQVPWKQGERETLTRQMGDAAGTVNKLIAENAAEVFASLPNE
jgi:hypothetical protein